MNDNGFDDFFDELHNETDGHTHSGGSHSSRRRQSRARRKSRFRRTLTLVISLLLVVGFVAGGLYVHRYIQRHFFSTSRKTEILDYLGGSYGSVKFKVPIGASGESIAHKLYDLGVVASPEAFIQALTSAEAENKIQPGMFMLQKHMPASDAVKILINADNSKGLIVVRQGDSSRKVFHAVADHYRISYDQFINDLRAVKGQMLPYEANGSFEGWLEPGAYDPDHFKVPVKLIEHILKIRIAKLNKLGVPNGAVRERILNVASITEAEANNSADYGKVARVIENRIAADMPLGMDSTVAYGADVKGFNLTKAMLNDESNPYNTRLHKGLPPTPISNAGDDAIKATMNPPAGSWLYFVTVDPDKGITEFTDNYEQFQQYEAQFQSWLHNHPNNHQ